MRSVALHSGVLTRLTALHSGVLTRLTTLQSCFRFGEMLGYDWYTNMVTSIKTGIPIQLV